jgi:hypothetical protein
MKTLKLVGAATFSSPTRGVVACQLGQTVNVQDDDANELLELSYMNENGQEIPYFSQNPEAPLLFKTRAVTLDMMELVKQNGGGGAKAIKQTPRSRVKQ